MSYPLRLFGLNAPWVWTIAESFPYVLPLKATLARGSLPPMRPDNLSPAEFFTQYSPSDRENDGMRAAEFVTGS